MSDLVWSRATERAAAIERRAVSAVEVLDAHLHRIERVNPALTAVVILDAEAVRARARSGRGAHAR